MHWSRSICRRYIKRDTDRKTKRESGKKIKHVHCSEFQIPQLQRGGGGRVRVLTLIPHAEGPKFHQLKYILGCYYKVRALTKKLTILPPAVFTYWCLTGWQQQTYYLFTVINLARFSMEKHCLAPDPFGDQMSPGGMTPDCSSLQILLFKQVPRA